MMGRGDAYWGRPNKEAERNVRNNAVDKKALSILLAELPLDQVNFFPHRGSSNNSYVVKQSRKAFM